MQRCARHLKLLMEGRLLSVKTCYDVWLKKIVAFGGAKPKELNSEEASPVKEQKYKVVREKTLTSWAQGTQMPVI